MQAAAATLLIVREHPNAAVIRRLYETRARGHPAPAARCVERALAGRTRTPLSISAVGELTVVIDCEGAELGLVVFRVVDGTVTEAHRVLPPERT